MGIVLQELKALVRQSLHLNGQRAIALPEGWRRVMAHSSVQRPASKSRSASSAWRSRRPAATSSSNCRSQTTASNSTNHLRKAARSCGDNARTGRFDFGDRAHRPFPRRRNYNARAARSDTMAHQNAGVRPTNARRRWLSKAGRVGCRLAAPEECRSGCTWPRPHGRDSDHRSLTVGVRIG